MSKDFYKLLIIIGIVMMLALLSFGSIFYGEKLFNQVLIVGVIICVVGFLGMMFPSKQLGNKIISNKYSSMTFFLVIVFVFIFTVAVLAALLSGL